MAQGERELAGAGPDRPKEREVPAEAVEVSPVRFYDKDFKPRNSSAEEDADLYDFRPVAVAADTPEASPKASSAQESVPSSDSTPTVNENTETPVSVEKDSGKSKENESGTQASSSKTSAGKSAQTA